jgi:hypothetical protein
MPNDTEKTPAEVGAEVGRQVGEAVGAAAGEAVSRIADQAGERIKQEARDRVAGIGDRARGAFGRVKQLTTGEGARDTFGRVKQFAAGGFRQLYDRSPAISSGVDRVRELPDRYPRQTLRAAFFVGLFLGFRAYGRRHRHA